MKPRKSNSDISKAGMLPPDLIKMISQEFKAEFEGFMDDKEIIIFGYIFLDEIYISIGFKEKGALRQYNFEASLDFDSQNEKALDKIHMAADAIDAMMVAYIESEDIQMPLEWRSVDMGSSFVFLRFNTINTELEKLADEFLRDNPEAKPDPKLEDPDFDPEIPIQ